LNLPNDWTVEFDLDGLLRMDAATMMKYLSDGVSSAIIEPNEARGRIGLAPKTGGDALYLQQQNYSLAALAKRDQSADPFSKGSPPNPAPNSTSDPNPAPSSVPNPDQTTNNSLVGDLSRRLLRFANNN
jgi:phage portal protein BeeE